MRLALAQINPTVGDLPGNAQRITHWIARARDAGAHLVALPELCLCGYPPRDLLLEEGFVEACAREARRLGESATAGITAIFGTPLPVPRGNLHGPIANSLVVYRDNTFVGDYDKRLLPTYDVFDEDRYFTPGDRAGVVEAAGTRVGLAVCEDLWKGEDAGFSARYHDRPDPVEAIAPAGAALLVVPSASPFVLGKGRRHRDILARHATRHGMYVASVNQVGGNDDLVFDGHAAVYAPDGTLIAACTGFVEGMTVLDLPPRGVAAPAVADPLLGAPDEELLFKALVLGTRDYVRKTGHRDVLIGLSGGIDSSVTAAIAVAALGPRHVTGVIMPGVYSSPHSREDAADLASRLGIRAITIPITPPLDGFRSAIDPVLVEHGQPRLGQALPDPAEENLQSRVRGTLLMTLSNRTGALVLTTGNKSELAVGYCTLYGDMNGGYAVLCDVSKMQVYALARWMNAHPSACGLPDHDPASASGDVLNAPRPLGFARPPIPERSITKPPSAELRPNQTDQDTLPPYDVLDAIITRSVERHESPATIARDTGFEPATVERVARMIRNAEFKRRQLASGPKVTTVAFGTGRRYPIAQEWRSR